MIESIRRALAFPRLPVQEIAAATTVLGFGWLLAHDLVQPIVIFMLELYLTF